MQIYYIGSPEIFGEGASAIHVARMCEAFSEIGHDVTLRIPISSVDEDRFFSFYGVKKSFKIEPSIGFKQGPLRHFFHGINSSIRTALLDKYDFIVTRNITFAFAASFIKKNIIVDIHHPPINYFSTLAIKRFLKSDSIFKIVCNSHGTKDILEKGFSSSRKMQVLHNGVNLNDFVPNQSINALKDRLAIPNESKIISYIGNTYKGRGIEKMIDLSKTHRNLYFLIVGGEKQDNEQYMKLIGKEQRNILFTNHIPHVDIPNYLLMSDILLIPYEKEFTIKGDKIATDYSSPIKLFEYLSSGKPIIASSLPPFSTILRNGHDALLVDPDSYEDLNKSLITLLEDDQLRLRLSENSLKLSKNFSWKKRASMMLADL